VSLFTSWPIHTPGHIRYTIDVASVAALALLNSVFA